jgi:hypothetical protein
MTIGLSSCLWRIAELGQNQVFFRVLIPARMRDVVILLVHLIVTVVRLARPGGLRSVIAESVLVKHQLLILNRGRTCTKQPIGLLHPGVGRTSEACCRPVEALHRGIPQKGASCQFSPLVPVKQLSQCLLSLGGGLAPIRTLQLFSQRDLFEVR